MTDATEPSDPKRVKSFVKYFNSYFAALTVAVIPIPVANWNWIPIWGSQRHLLSVITPIFCFLTLGFLFFYRQALAGPMFPDSARRGRLMDMLQFGRKLRYVLSQSWDRTVNLAPLALIASSFWCASQYYIHFIASQNAGFRLADNAPLKDIPEGGALIFFFVMAFVLAEAAFVWMALKEYIQDVLRLSDEDLMTAPPPETTPGS
jgi:hypothetical protein